MNVRSRFTMVAIIAAAAVSGCSAGAPTRSDATAPTARNSIPPGMNANGEVIDTSKVESGHGQTVKGINDFSGEITGIAAPNSRFSQLQIGMGMRQAIDICGPPSDQGAYITGKAFIPFYFGSDRSRFELIYKGQGRLIFAGGSIGNYSGGNLVWIINSANEPGYR
jgi:hypothetical protein